MATNFPNSPSNGDTHTFGGATYTYNSTIGAWTGPSTTAGGGASVTVSETAPSSPSEGDLWFDPSVLKTFVYYNDGTANQWVQSNPTGSGGSGGGGASVTASDTAPTSPSAGDLWFKSDTGALYVYYTDADSSQWVGISGPAGADGAAGATGASASVSYANLAAFPSSPTEGDIAYAQDTNALYVYDGSEWDRISSGSDESPRVTTEPPTTTQDLNYDGTTSTVTMVAEDPEGFDIEYGIRYNTAGNTLPPQLASATTINQSTGVYTFTPTTTTSNAGTFTARLTASDGNRVTTRNVNFNLEFFVATGGTISTYTDGSTNYKVHKFTSSGTFSVTTGSTSVDYLIVGGGGGGAYNNYNGVAGSGGGVVTGTTTVDATTGTYSISVGNGGVGASGGFSSGGAGQGSSAFGQTAGGGTAPSLNATTSGSPQSNPSASGAGGGAGGSPTSSVGADGLASSITGTSVLYGPGGGYRDNVGGNDGGGDGASSGVAATDGAPNSGGGGGGGSYQVSQAGGDGGSGVVIIRYEV